MSDLNPNAITCSVCLREFQGTGGLKNHLNHAIKTRYSQSKQDWIDHQELFSEVFEIDTSWDFFSRV